LIGITSIASGALLLIGFLTPIASVLVSLGAGFMAFARLRLHNGNFIETSWMSASMVLITVAVTLLGPGAFSIDAQLFGRRKIVIPRRRT
jgi:uncharacterized membrane protein YphA (DoxX/SURF4 family)